MKYYYIKMINLWTGRVAYKRYKRGEGFSLDKKYCWKFTKQSSKKIIERLKFLNRMNVELIFELEEAETEVI